jgi:general secretion pathway protein B
MSYILDAMRKTERDRALGPAVNLPPQRAGNKLLRYGALAVIVLALIAAGIWFALSKYPSLLLMTMVNPSPPDIPTNVSAPATNQTPVVTVTQSADETPPVAIPPAVTQPVATAALDNPPAATSAPDKPTASRVIELVSDDWEELPESHEVADRLPEQLLQLRVGIHVYDADPRKRMVLINGRRFQEGDALPQGGQIIEITPKGLALKYQSTRFHKSL